MTPKSALITGASRGIGRGIAESLARQGFGLTICSRKGGDLEALAPHLRELGASTIACVAVDMADRDGIGQAVALHARTFETMNALILSAGIGTAGPIATFPMTRLDKTLAVNFTGAFVMIQAALPQLRAAAAGEPIHGAKILALSSITGVYAEAGLAAYGATKAAILSLIDTVNAEESGNGVSACSIAPGFVATDMSAWTRDTIPADDMIQVSDVVKVVELALKLSRNACIPRVVMSRRGTSGYSA